MPSYGYELTRLCPGQRAVLSSSKQVLLLCCLSVDDFLIGIESQEMF